MVNVAVSFQTKKAKKFLRDVQSSVKTARRYAATSAARKTRTEIKRRLAKGAKVPAKYVDSRIGVGKWSEKRQGIMATLYYTHINPAGTKKYPIAVKTNYRITKKGKKGKGHGNIVAMGRTYERAFLISKNYKIPMIMQREGKKNTPFEWQKIPLGQWAINMKRNVVNTKFKRDFKVEYDRIFKAAVKKHAR